MADIEPLNQLYLIKIVKLNDIYFFMQILILTDSLGFPRSEPEFVSYEQSWIGILKSVFPEIDFIHCGNGGNTLPQLIDKSIYYHTTLKPILVLVQSGVVDAAPRSLTVVENMVLNHIPLLRLLVRPVVNRWKVKLRKWRNIRYCPPKQFAESIIFLEKTYDNILWIGIPPALKEWERKVPGIGSSINKYNNILKKQKFVSLEDFGYLELTSDFHHLTVRGHARLADRLIQQVSNVLSALNSPQKEAEDNSYAEDKFGG